MAEQVIAASTVSPPELPVTVSAEEYMEHYAAHFYEWVDGKVIEMSPVTYPHDRLTKYFDVLFQIYFRYKPIGWVAAAPFVMSIPAIKVKREPDVQVILNDNPGTFTKTYMDGPADICIEVVSPESVERDHGQKFAEYEKGKVKEYWIIDPVHKDVRFYRLDEQGLYEPQYIDAQGNYRTPLLPQFVLHVPTLWQEPLPDPVDIMKAVKGMVGEASQE